MNEKGQQEKSMELKQNWIKNKRKKTIHQILHWLSSSQTGATPHSATTEPNEE